MLKIPKPRMLEILSSAGGDKVIDYSVVYSKPDMMQGIGGEYLLPVFQLHTESRGMLELSLFVRMQLYNSPGSRQTHHYYYLADQNVPTPAFYGGFVNEDDREVIFLELLNPVKDEDTELLNRPDFVEEFVKLAALFNGVRLSPEYIGNIGRDLAGRDYVRNWNIWLPWSAHVLQQIGNFAAEGKLGENIKKYCSKNYQTLINLQEIVNILLTTIGGFPVGLIHGDMRPGNTGWRRNNGQLVLFDFEDIMIDARFYDIAQIIGGSQPLVKGTKSNNDLAEYYLEIYNHNSPSEVTLDIFLREAKIIWFARKVNLWEYLPPEAGGPAYNNRAFIAKKDDRLNNLLLILEQLKRSFIDLIESINLSC